MRLCRHIYLLRFELDSWALFDEHCVCFNYDRNIQNEKWELFALTFGQLVLVCHPVVFYDNHVIATFGLSMSLIKFLLDELWPSDRFVIVLNDVDVGFLRRCHLERTIDSRNQVLAEAEAHNERDDEHRSKHHESNQHCV